MNRYLSDTRRSAQWQSLSGQDEHAGAEPGQSEDKAIGVRSASKDVVVYANLTGTSGPDILEGTAGMDVINGLGGNDVLYGLGGNDTLDGGDGDDVLYGGDSSNILIGGAGNDVLVSDGIDTLEGGEGNDTYILNTGGGLISDSGTSNGDIVYFYTSGALETGIEAGVLIGIFPGTQTGIFGNALDNLLIGNNGPNSLDGGDGNDTIYGVGGFNTLSGGSGNDVLVGGTGSDTMRGGLGDDVFIIQNGDTLREDAGQGRDTVYVLSGSYFLAPFDDVEVMVLIGGGSLGGNTLNNTLIGDGGANALNGGDGNDFLVGGGGNDLLYGGAGLDTMQGHGGVDIYAYRAASEFGDIIQDWVHTEDRLQFFASGFGFTVGQTLVEGTNFFAATAPLATGTGPSFLWDTDDTALYFDADGTGAGAAVLVADLQAFTTMSVQNLVFAANAEEWDGKDVPVMEDLFGQEEDVTAAPERFDDKATGGQSASKDKVVYADLTGTDGPDDLVGTAGNDVLNGLGGNDALYGLAGDDTLNGGDGDDVLYGGFGANTLNGGAGNDVLVSETLADQLFGGEGNDTYILNAGNVLISDLGTTTGDLVYSYGDLALATGIDSGVIFGTATTLTGNALDNLLIGNSSNNTFFGGDGADTIYGVGGTNTLNAGTGNDVLVSGTGIDTLRGGSGDDVYIIQSGDVLQENAGEGRDTVYVLSGSHFLAPFDDIEVLVLIGGGSLGGNGLDNTLIGDGGANALNGGAGNDFLVGGGGNDLLYGGAGLDTMQGHGGVDIYAYRAASEFGDIIQDWVHTEDRLQFFASGFGFTVGQTLVEGTNFFAATAPLATGTGPSFLWDTDDTALYFDADGTGAGAAVLVADLQAFTTMSVQNLVFAANAEEWDGKDVPVMEDVFRDEFAFDAAPVSDVAPAMLDWVSQPWAEILA